MFCLTNYGEKWGRSNCILKILTVECSKTVCQNLRASGCNWGLSGFMWFAQIKFGTSIVYSVPKFVHIVRWLGITLTTHNVKKIVLSSDNHTYRINGWFLNNRKVILPTYQLWSILNNMWQVIKCFSMEVSWKK